MLSRQSSTRKVKKTLDDVEQGLPVLFSPDGESATVDIVAVPGLGAHPVDSWKGPGDGAGFNFLTSKDGLQRDFPKARILLYKYGSAWQGALKVKANLDDIGSTLLKGLMIKRERCPQRPIVFIGHSMGGLVIAKAVTISDQRPELYPKMFPSIAGCVFFGTPFDGAPAAAVAAMYAHIRETLDGSAASQLPKTMTPGNDTVKKLRSELLRVASKLAVKIELFCFYEKHQTNFSKLVHLPPVFDKLFQVAIPASLADFVNQDSAVLPGLDTEAQMGLDANHSDLVKFKSCKDERYMLVRAPLKRMIRDAMLTAKGRFTSSRDVDREMINGVLDVLEGESVAKMRKKLQQVFSPSPWMSNNKDYREWLPQENLDATDSSSIPSHRRSLDCLWIQGSEGRGKTNAVMAALDGIDAIIRKHEEDTSGGMTPLLAYFYCGASAECTTAEDVLKSLIHQLIKKNESLATYAKMFYRKKENSTDSSRPATTSQRFQPSLTVENLWQTLQDMLSDDFVGSTVYIVLNNLHALSPELNSTNKFLDFLYSELEGIAKPESVRSKPVKWLITSRNNSPTGKVHTDSSQPPLAVRMIDLEADEYGNEVQIELRKQAHARVDELSREKEYSKALAYFVSSLLSKRAKSRQWIDIACVRLAELPVREKEFRIRRILEAAPGNLDKLLEHAWENVFGNCTESSSEQVKEMLRSLVLTYEDPSEAELGVIAGIPDSEDGRLVLQQLVKQCRPLLTIKRSSKGDTRVAFVNPAVKIHLKKADSNILFPDNDSIRLQQGMVAYRCFEHIAETLQVPERNVLQKSTKDEVDSGVEEEPDELQACKKVDAPSVTEKAEGEGNDEDETSSLQSAEITGYEDSDTDWESKEDEGYDYVTNNDVNPAQEVEDEPQPLVYAIKHWLHHASKATPEMTERLSKETVFWDASSELRKKWLRLHVNYTDMFSTAEIDEDVVDLDSWTSIHVAATAGYSQLVAALFHHGGYESLRDHRDHAGSAPIVWATLFGRSEVVKTLLKNGADVNDGQDADDDTPLHAAAIKGNVNLMQQLKDCGANINAISKNIGPVMNAAIYSGNKEAVEFLVNSDVSLSEAFRGKDDEEDINYPGALTVAAEMPDLSMFNYLMHQYRESIPPSEYSRAFIASVRAGRFDVFEKLLQFEHSQNVFQEALTIAALEENWGILTTLLVNTTGLTKLDCATVFLDVANLKVFEKQVTVLGAIWTHNKDSVSEETIGESLYEATDNENLPTVRFLLETCQADPNVSYENRFYGNPLTAAAYDGTTEIIEILLEHGAEVNSSHGCALKAAAGNGHNEAVILLLKSGAEINDSTTVGFFEPGTPLQAACDAGWEDTVEILLSGDAGLSAADPNLGGGYYTRPIISAARRGELGILKKLVAHGAVVNISGGPDGSTPLINAAMSLPCESIQILLDEGGADIDMIDNDGDNALIIAAMKGDEETVRFLLERGANIMHVSPKHDSALKAALHSENTDCLNILLDHMEGVMRAISEAVITDNEEVVKVLRNAHAPSAPSTQQSAESDSGDIEEKHNAMDQED